MEGYHLRFLKPGDTGRTIDSADIVRVPSAQTDGYNFGVQLHALPRPPAPGKDVVMRLLRNEGESESEFVKRAFSEAATRRRQAAQLG